MRQGRILSGAVLFLLLTLPARAAVAQGKADTTRRPDMSPIVVTATQVPVPAVTASTTVLSGTALREQGITHVLDALRTVPGLAIVQTGSFGGRAALYMRGGESGYTRVLIDGVPANDPGGDFNFADLSTESIDRIEIVRGPASVLYGTDAVAGVIQIFTRRGDGPPRGNATIAGGNLYSTALTAGLSGGSSTARYAFDVARYAGNGIYAFNNQYRRGALSGSVTLSPDTLTLAHLVVQYGDNTAHIPTDGSGAVVDRNAFQFSERLTAGLDVARTITSRLDARLLLSGYTDDGSFDDAQDDAADTLGFYASNGLAHVVRRTAELRLNVRAVPAVVITGGGVVEDQRERSFSRSQSDFGPSGSEFVVTRATRAGYLQVVGTVAGFAWNLSGRVDDSDAFGAFGTWRAGVAYLLPTGTRLRGAAGRAFREPTFFQNYASGFVRGNPALRPERAQSWELGIEQRLIGDRVALSGTWFDQRFRDIIEFTFTTASPTDPNYFNIAGARSRGLEMEARANLPGGVSARVAHTWVSTEVLDPGFDQSGFGLFVAGQSLLRRPEHMTNLVLDVRVGGVGSFAARALAFGARDDIDFNAGQRVRLPSYATVDVSGSVDVWRRDDGRPRVTLTARLANVLGEKYEAVFGYPSPGRTALGGVRFGF